MWILSVTLSPEVVTAFLAGSASIVGSTFAIKRARKEEHEACAERLKEQREVYERGMEVGMKVKERDA